jgi:hypothetical protein
MGPQAVSILINLNSALANCYIIVPTIDKNLGCTSDQEVKDIPNPVEGVPGFEGSAIYIPGPIFRNAIIASNSTDCFKLIPLIQQQELLQKKLVTQPTMQMTLTPGYMAYAEEPFQKQGTQFSQTTLK